METTEVPTTTPRYVVERIETGGYVVVDTRPVLRVAANAQAIWRRRDEAQAVANELNLLSQS